MPATRGVSIDRQSSRRLPWYRGAGGAKRWETEDRLRSAHELAQLGSWEWRPDTNEVVIVQALPGGRAQAGARTTLEEFLLLLPSEERQGMREDLLGLERGELNQSIRRHRSELLSGTAWLETRMRAVRDSTGSLLLVRATAQNVTEDEGNTQRARDSMTLLQGTLDSLLLNVAVIDGAGKVIMTNRAWSEFGAANGGGTTELGANYLDVCDRGSGDKWAEQAGAGLRAIMEGEESEFTMEYPCHSPDEERWFSLRAARYEGPGDACIVVAHRDITVRRQAETMVKLQASLIDEVDVAIVASDGDGLVTYWNEGAHRLFGWTAAEALKARVSDLITPSDETLADDIAGDLRRIGLSEEHIMAARKDGSLFPAYVRRKTLSGDVGLPGWTVDVTIDISRQVGERRELLSTRNYLRAVTDSMGEGLFTLDPEGRLTYINKAAEAMLGWSRHDLLGRVMHDITHTQRPDGSELAIADSPILKVHRDGHTAHVDSDVFIHRTGLRVPVAYTASPLLDDEDVKGCVVVFEDISERRAREERIRLEAEKLAIVERIKGALEDDQLVLYAQPIIDLQSKETVQRELLLRMREPGGEVVGPGSFLQVAEQYGLIGEIDRWVIRQAIGIAATGCPVQINISACSIGDLTMLDHIGRCLDQEGADPALLVMELTETAIIANETAALKFAEGLHSLGCGLALDDFGTGYGSFTYLKQLPVDYLKIDIEFVRDLATSDPSRHVVKAVVALAQAFGIRTVGEGVEDAETLNILQEMGVDFAQGYHIGRPAPPEFLDETISMVA